MALACGLSVANLYYAQPLAGPISRALGMKPAFAGLVVTLTQVGYGVGLILLAPLGDLVENRRLVALTAAGGALALAATALAPNAGVFLASALLVGVGSTAAQMLLPIAAHMAPERARGRVVGEVMSGLIAGILLARPIASLIADHLGWRPVFGLSAVLMLALSGAVLKVLPERRPAADHTYASLLGSLGALLAETPVLQRRGFYQACMFAAFSLFWTVAPLLLEGPVYRMSQTGIAIFALAGAGGALIAPVAGRMADRGWTRPATGAAFAAAALCFAMGWFGQLGNLVGLALLVAGAVVLDLGVQTSQVMGQRAIYSLAADVRSRLNGLYIALLFVGGAIGSGVGGAIYAWAGWSGACVLGLLFCAMAAAAYVTEFTA